MITKPHAPANAADDQGFVDLLRLLEADRRALTQRNPSDARSAQRAAALSLPGVRAELTQPAGNTGKYIVYPAELSPTSIAVLHGAFVHPQSVCTLYFRAADNEPLMMKGKVASCVHVKGRAHEVVLELENPIDLNLLVPAGVPAGAAGGATVTPGATEQEGATHAPDAVAQLQELAKELAALSKSLASDQKASAQARQLAARAMLIAKSMAA